MRGRVLGLFTVSFLGMFPLGSLAAGAAADWIGPKHTLAAGGIACMLVAVWLWRRLPELRSHIRPSAGSPCRSMLRSVPVGMSSEWTGMIKNEPSCKRHFWCEPSWWTTRAVGSSMRIRRITSRCLTVVVRTTSTISVKDLGSQAP